MEGECLSLLSTIWRYDDRSWWNRSSQLSMYEKDLSIHYLSPWTFAQVLFEFFVWRNSVVCTFDCFIYLTLFGYTKVSWRHQRYLTMSKSQWNVKTVYHFHFIRRMFWLSYQYNICFVFVTLSWHYKTIYLCNKDI